MVKQHHRVKQPQMPLLQPLFLCIGGFKIRVNFQDGLWSWKLESRPAAPFESKAECRLLLHAKTYPHAPCAYAHATLNVK